MKRIVSFIVVFTLVMGGMTHVQAQSKAVEKAEKKLEREAKKEAREAKDAIMAAADTDSPCLRNTGCCGRSTPESDR